MGRVALLESLPSQHAFRSLRHLQAKQSSEQKMIHLQLEVGQLKYDCELLHVEVLEWRSGFVQQPWAGITHAEECSQQADAVLQELSPGKQSSKHSVTIDMADAAWNAAERTGEAQVLGSEEMCPGAIDDSCAGGSAVARPSPHSGGPSWVADPKVTRSRYAVQITGSWEPLDPWLFLDRVELSRVSATCCRNSQLVNEYTPFGCFSSLVAGRETQDMSIIAQRFYGQVLQAMLRTWVP